MSGYLRERLLQTGKRLINGQHFAGSRPQAAHQRPPAAEPAPDTRQPASEPPRAATGRESATDEDERQP